MRRRLRSPALVAAMALSVTALASDRPVGEQAKSDLQHAGYVVKRDSQVLGARVAQGSHRIGAEFRRAGRQFSSDMRQAGHSVQVWWQDLRQRLHGSAPGA